MACSSAAAAMRSFQPYSSARSSRGRSTRPRPGRPQPASANAVVDRGAGTVVGSVGGDRVGRLHRHRAPVAIDPAAAVASEVAGDLTALLERHRAPVVVDATTQGISLVV